VVCNASDDDPDGDLDSVSIGRRPPGGQEDRRTGGQEELFPAVGADEYNSEEGAFTLSYDQRIELKTSFTGKVMLSTRLRACR